MAGQAEAGDVGHGVHALQRAQRNAHAVELRGVAQHVGIASGIQNAFFEGRRKNAHTQRLAQHQHVASLRVGVAAHALGVHQAQAHQAVDGLEHVDRMPARNGDAGFAAHGGAAFEHAANHFGWQLGNGHAHQCQRHDGRAAHGIDV